LIFSGTLGNRLLSGSLKPGSFTVMLDGVESLTYDRAGRLWSRWIDARTYRRGLGGAIMEKASEAGQRRRRWLNREEADALLDESAALMRELADRLTSGAIAWTIEPDGDGLSHALARAARFDARAAADDRARFDAVYDPIGILPPDQYLALVLQATVGCSFNTCAFCNFYHDRRFRVKSESAFRRHARAVRAFLGDAIHMRRSIFLGEANALTVPFDRLASLLAIAREEIGAWPVHAFVDAFSGARKSVDEYRALGQLGLARVSIGLESGHDPLLRWVRKPGTAQDVGATVAALKAAGIAVSVIVLVGLGGDRYAERHAADTVAALNAMPLDRDDIVYFSDLVEHGDTRYPVLAYAEGIRSLARDEMQAQREAIRHGLRFGPDGPIVSRYDIREFVY
jgi:radical SAM superfamily enzyme YgiQ (UPF0313 family)